ncbi:MAG: pyridoxal-phosphate dependent enzyme, partial [Conexivisphaera sp.]
ALTYSNSLAVEGLKTIALEALERLPRIDRVFVPAETGLLALSVWKGLRDAGEAGADARPEVHAAVIRGTAWPELLRRIEGVTLHEVDPEKAVEGIVRLARAGIRAKVLSAAAFALAEAMGGGLAIVTASQRRVQPGPRRPGLAEDVLRVVREMGEASAYEAWGRLRGRTLRGVYKAIESLEEDGRLCARYVMRGNRRVKVYFDCGTAGVTPRRARSRAWAPRRGHGASWGAL